MSQPVSTSQPMSQPVSTVPGIVTSKTGHMKILLINLEFDCAGVSWMLTEAIRNHTKHEVKHVMRRVTHVATQTDHFFTHTRDHVLPLCEWADVLHFNQWIWTHQTGISPVRFPPMGTWPNDDHPFRDILPRKQVVFHFHGGMHQVRPDYWLEECRKVNAKIIKCDPVSPIPGAVWLPNVLDIEPKMRVNHNGAFRVAIHGHIGDKRRNNQFLSDLFRYTCVDHTMFTGKPRTEALLERQAYQATVDNITQGFIGMWGWEAMAMGSVLISRLAPDAEQGYANLGDRPPPIINAANADCATVETLRLKDDRVLCKQLGYAGIGWMQKNYTPAKIAEMYVRFYSDETPHGGIRA